MTLIRLFDWNTSEIDKRSEILRTAGYIVDHRPIDQETLRALRVTPPAAAVIALDRRPSQGRDIGLVLRKTKATRLVPLVFVGGEIEKVQAVQMHLPDATFTTWERLIEDLEGAIANPVIDPVVPGSVFDPYATTPLPKKLGLRAGSLVCLLDAPDGFEETLGQLPRDVNLTRQQIEACDIVLWFVREQAAFNRELTAVAERGKGTTLWVIWPKKASGVPSDLSQPVVRAAGLKIGLVDFKVCSVDQTWTGLCFRWRK